MNKTNQYLFECDFCRNETPETVEHYAPVDDWVLVYPKQRTIHIHFGTSTSTDKVSSEEARLVYITCVHKGYERHPKTQFFLLGDFSRGDDSEFPSNEAMRLYGKLMSHPQSDIMVGYGGFCINADAPKNVDSHYSSSKTYKNCE